MRTLIVAHGLERARILAAISVHAPNRVLVLRNTEDISKKLKEEVEKNMQLLKKELLQVQKGLRLYPFIFDVDIKNYKTNFFDTLNAYTYIDNIIKKELEKDNEVSIDISTGNKTIAIALFLAGQTNDIKITYCKAGMYLGKECTPSEIATSAKEPLEFTKLPFVFEDLPYDVLLELKKIEKSPSVSALIREMSMKVNKSSILSVSRKLDILKDHGYVKTSRTGNRKEISITKLGKEIAKIR